MLGIGFKKSILLHFLLERNGAFINFKLFFSDLSGLLSKFRGTINGKVLN